MTPSPSPHSRDLTAGSALCPELRAYLTGCRDRPNSALIFRTGAVRPLKLIRYSLLPSSIVLRCGRERRSMTRQSLRPTAEIAGTGNGRWTLLRTGRRGIRIHCDVCRYIFILRNIPRARSEYLIWLSSQSTTSCFVSSVSPALMPSMSMRSFNFMKDFTNCWCWALWADMLE